LWVECGVGPGLCASQSQCRRWDHWLFQSGWKDLKSVGIQCALCDSTVDDSFAPGIGRRLDGWPNRDLDIGAIVATAPDLSAFVKMLEVDEATVRKSI
jgi:hypothetical protein